MPDSNDTVLLQEKADVVALHISIDGENIPRQYQLASLTVRQELNKIPAATLVVVDGEASEQDFSISSSGAFAPGRKLALRLEYEHSDEDGDAPFLFQGIIVTNTHKVSSHCCELTVECKDETIKMTLAKSNAHFEKNTTASKVAEQLLEKNKIENYSVGQVSLVHEQLMQSNQTDWDFLLGRIDVAGMICVITNGAVTIRELKIEKPPVNESGKMLRLVHGRNLLSFSADKDSRIRNEEVKIVTWDFREQKIKEAANSDSVVDDNSNTQSITSGYEVRSTIALSQEEQETLARVKKIKQDLSSVKGRVSFLGRTDIQLLPGDFIEVTGVGKTFDGFHFVSAVQQEYNDGCWVTEATLGWDEQFFVEQTAPTHAASAAGQPSSLQGLQIGIVTSILDSEGEYRVRVKLPLVDSNADGLHARVATLDAGNKRGSVFRPEIDDEVVLGFLNDDPSNPVILGMLHSSAKPAPLEPEEQNAKKGFISRSGMQLLFDDEKNSITIKTPGSRVVELNDAGGTLTLQDGNGNKIVMEKDGIRIESAKKITLKAGGDFSLKASQISQKADMNLEAKAGASVKINGGGQTEIKGGIVNIN